MQFKYTYQDREGRVHEELIESLSQAEAYSALRKVGIRPMRVWPKDDAAKERPVKIGKRVLCAAVGLTALAVGGAAYFLGRSSAPAQPASGAIRSAQAKTAKEWAISSNIVEFHAGRRIAKARPRRQIELPAASNLTTALVHPVDRLLMRYVRPGRLSSEPLPDLAVLEDDFYASLEDVIWIEPEDVKSVVELKRIIQTLKNEAEARTLDGATFNDVISWFEQRQKMEANYRRDVIVKNPPPVANKLLESMALEPVK